MENAAEEGLGKGNPKRGGASGGGRSPAPASEDEGKNKPKLNLQIKTLADDVRDRITSFRKSGVKKEKLLIQHPIDSQTSINELPMAQPLFDERSMNLSEKEVMDLFEKMMEDMNLNEERKAPLRNKDLTTKREMVVQYISATAKSDIPPTPPCHYSLKTPATDAGETSAFTYPCLKKYGLSRHFTIHAVVSTALDSPHAAVQENT